MAVIYLRHPIHGAKVACLDLEADADEKNGWVRYTPEQVVEPVPAVESIPEEVPNFLAPRRRGRPPKSVDGA